MGTRPRGRRPGVGGGLTAALALVGMLGALGALGCGGGGGNPFLGLPATLQINNTTPDVLQVAVGDPASVVGTVPATSVAGFSVVAGIRDFYITVPGGSTTTFSNVLFPAGATVLFDWP